MNSLGSIEKGKIIGFFEEKMFETLFFRKRTLSLYKYNWCNQVYWFIMEKFRMASTEFGKGVLDIESLIGVNDGITSENNKFLNGEEYKSIIELSSDGIFIGDRQGKVISWNNGMENLTGIKLADAVDQNMWDIIYQLTPKEYQNPTFLSTLEKRFLSIINDWAYWQKKVYEHKMTGIDGTVIIVELSTFVTASPNGNLIVAALRDVSSQKQAEMSLALKYEALLKLNQFSIELSKLSSEDNMEALISRRIKEFTGAIGVVFSEYNAETRTLTPKHIELEPDMLEVMVSLFDNHVHKIQTVLRDYMYHELTSTIIRIGSSLFEVSLGAIPFSVGATAQSMLMADRFIRVSYLVNGKLYGTSLLAMGQYQPDPPMEILENFVFLAASAIQRRRKEEALRKSEEILRTIAENAGDIILNLDAEGTILYTNRVMPGYEKKDMIGRNFCEWTLPEYHEQMTESLDCVFNRAIPQTYQSRALGLDHEIRWYLSRLSPVITGGDVKNAILSITDITEKKQEEKALRVSEENYRVIAQSTFDVIFIIDRSGKQLFFNKSVERVLGYKIEELVGRSFSDFLPEDSVAEYLKQLGNVFLYKEVCRFVTLMYHKDGSLLNVEINIKLVKLKGEYVGQGSIRDITAKMRSEEEFRINNARNNALLEAIPDLMFVFNSNCKIVGFHSESNDLMPEDSETYLGKYIDDILPQEVAVITHEKVEKVLSTGKAENSTYRMQIGGVLKYFESRYVPCGKNEVLSMIRDITLQKHSEENLNIAKESYLDVFNSVAEAIYLLDESGTYIDVNKSAEKMHLRDKQEFIGKTLEIFAAPDLNNLAEIKNLMNRVTDTGVPACFECWVQRKNGEVFPEEVFVNKGKYFGKNVLIATARDISEKKQAEEMIKLKNEELQNINSEKDKFFSIIAHDLRSPFNSFLGLTQIMADDLPNLSLNEIQTMASSMSKSATNLYSLLENLLQWARIQQGAIPFTPEIVQLKPLIDECIAITLETAKNKGIDISYNIQENTAVFVDSNMLQTVIRNLVSNAIKFTCKGGKISVSAKTGDNNSIEISVRDTGIGMSREMVDNLFRPDVKTSRKGTENEPSTGLGLILCKEFVEKHGGQIWAESEVGKGSTFYFTIPSHNNNLISTV